MPNYHALYYLVSITPGAIIALECADGDYSQLADVAIPYHDGGDIYACTCYLANKLANQLAVGEMLFLSKYAQLLAQRGDESSQFENVCAFYRYGAKPGDKVQGTAEFARPQDYRHERWTYRKILYIVTQDQPWTSRMLYAGTSYIVNSWVDVPMHDAEMMSEFSAVFPMTPKDPPGEEDSYYDDPEPPLDPEDTQAIPASIAAQNLGACCSCLAEGPTVRNIMALPYRAPVDGTGWGCFECGKPNNGAVAVICDFCLENNSTIRQVCVGYPGENRRALTKTLTEPFDHDHSRHKESTTHGS